MNTPSNVWRHLPCLLGLAMLLPHAGTSVAGEAPDIASGILARVLAFNLKAAQTTAALAGVPKTPLPVTDSGAYTHMNAVWWMDNHRLIFNGSAPGTPPNDADPQSRRFGILIWDVRDNSIKVFQDNRGRKKDEGWELNCFYYGTQRINYMRSEFTKQTPFKEWRTYGRRGVMGSEVEEMGLGASAPTPQNSRKVSNPHHHPYTCEPKPEAYAPWHLVEGRSTIALLEEHGYIDIGPYPSTPKKLKESQDIYYKVGAKPIPLDFEAIPPFGDHRYFYRAGNGGYHPFLNRYQWGINPVTLFNPDDGSITSHLMPPILGANPLWPILSSHSQYSCSIGITATREGFIVQCSGFPEAGLYQWLPAQDNTVTALVQGEETDQHGQISPDGCRFAFVSWKPRRISRTSDIPERDKTLKVMNLCGETR
ncbi:hypothetical protein [Zoogloea sp.]|uniref:hypothetical protein n=1 Tax=Zoogloea sp. TaxID=49181 RepID=UPI001E16BE57|nr:hypothetical protein [Zoogloea sp.]MBK6654831.1 hypothetical protein [Zoogloea sp.]